MYFVSVATYARLLGFLPHPRYRHLLITTIGFILICLYSLATTRILLRRESFFPFNSTIHMYTDILSSTVSAVSVNVAFVGNCINSRSMQRSLQNNIGNCNTRIFVILHAVTNGINTVIVLATYFILNTPSSLEYVFFHCYEAWALSLEALAFYTVATYWTEQYICLNRDALTGRPLEIVGRHVSLTKSTTKSVNQLEVQLMFVTGSGFLRLVVLAFYAAESAELEGGAGTMMTQYARQALLCAAAVVVIARAGENLHQEAAMTGKWLHSVAWSKSDDITYIRELVSASLQLLMQPLRLKICGLLSLDNTLLFTVTGATCTYVVVLLQFTVSASLKGARLNYTNTNEQNVSLDSTYRILNVR